MEIGHIFSVLEKVSTFRTDFFFMQFNNLAPMVNHQLINLTDYLTDVGSHGETSPLGNL